MTIHPRPSFVCMVIAVGLPSARQRGVHLQYHDQLREESLCPSQVGAIH